MQWHFSIDLTRKWINKKKRNNKEKNKEMIIVPLKEGENIERALKKFKRKYERTGVVKALRMRKAFVKPSVANRKARQHAVYVEAMRRDQE